MKGLSRCTSQTYKYDDGEFNVHAWTPYTEKSPILMISNL